MSWQQNVITGGNSEWLLNKQGGLRHISLLLSSSSSDKELTSCISRGEGLPLNSEE
jgi:hypothetical protein